MPGLYFLALRVELARQLRAPGVLDHFGAVLQVQAVNYLAHVVFDGALAEAKFRRRLFVLQALRDERQHLPLTLREAGSRALLLQRARLSTEFLENSGGEARRTDGFSVLLRV